MREAGFARGFVGGADFVPDHMGDDRRAMIRNNHDFKPVAEGEVGDFGSGGRHWQRQAKPQSTPTSAAEFSARGRLQLGFVKLRCRTQQATRQLHESKAANKLERQSNATPPVVSLTPGYFPELLGGGTAEPMLKSPAEARLLPGFLSGPMP